MAKYEWTRMKLNRIDPPRAWVQSAYFDRLESQRAVAVARHVLEAGCLKMAFQAFLELGWQRTNKKFVIFRRVQPQVSAHLLRDRAETECVLTRQRRHKEVAYCKTQNLAEKTFINFVFDLRRQAKRRLVRRKAVLLLRAMH